MIKFYIEAASGIQSADVFLDLGGRRVKELGVGEVVAKRFENDGVLMTVTNSFVQNKAHSDNLFIFNVSLSVF